MEVMSNRHTTVLSLEPEPDVARRDAAVQQVANR